MAVMLAKTYRPKGAEGLRGWARTKRRFYPERTPWP
jgi:hypothetical protein